MLAVMGGFHLGFPTTPRENVALAVKGMEEREVAHVVPMHCSGLATHAAFHNAQPERYLQPSVGTTLRFGT